MNNTFTYYNKNYESLLFRYNNADTTELHKIFIKYIPAKSSLLDLGFGSGRDLHFLYNKGYRVYGLDNCKNFINSFSSKNIQVSYTKLPDIDLTSFNIKQFNSIISIATLMHLTKKQIKETIMNIKTILSKKGIVVISYSTASREKDERFFEKLDSTFMKKEFEKLGFLEIHTSVLKDGMNRNIDWVTQVFKND